MSTSAAVAFLLVGSLLAVGSVYARVHSNGRYELKTGDLALILVPLVLFALVTGKVKALDVMGVKADLSDIIATAGKVEIGKQAAKPAPATVEDVLHAVEMGAKGGMDMLPQLLQRKVEGLTFVLGETHYAGPAIKAYLEALSGSSSLRYVVVNGRDGRLAAFYRAPELVAFLRLVGERGYAEVQDLLATDTPGTRDRLARMPGYVSPAQALQTTTTKIDALRRMEQTKVDSLPVLGPDQRFSGVVERGPLTTGLILAVSEEVEKR